MKQIGRLDKAGFDKIRAIIVFREIGNK